MRYDALTVEHAQRRAFAMLSSKDIITTEEDSRKCGVNGVGRVAPVPGPTPGTTITVPVKDNPYYSHPDYITSPVEIIQEQPFVNTSPQFVFDFSLQAPVASATLNNVRLAQNDIIAIYGIQILQGLGANANNRIYRSYGIAANDNSLYNSTISMKLETNTLIDQVQGQGFRDVPNTGETYDQMGMILINPIRVFTGRLGKFFVNINLINPIAALALTADVFISVRLKCVLGQAMATK